MVTHKPGPMTTGKPVPGRAANGAHGGLPGGGPVLLSTGVGISASNYGESGWRSGGPFQGCSHASWDASEAASAQAERFLPDFVIAWLLLQRSGLDATERSVIVAKPQERLQCAEGQRGIEADMA